MNDFINRINATITLLTCLFFLGPLEIESQDLPNFIFVKPDKVFAAIDECLLGDCENGYGIAKNEYGTYKGNFENGIKSGYGIFSFDSIGVYIGNWDSNFPNGQGMQIQFGDFIYEGSFVNGQREGFGRIEYLYSGSKFNSRKIIDARPDFGVYVGGWKSDLYQGEGKLYRANSKLELEGVFKNHKIDDESSFIYYNNDGHKYMEYIVGRGINTFNLYGRSGNLLYSYRMDNFEDGPCECDIYYNNGNLLYSGECYWNSSFFMGFPNGEGVFYRYSQQNKLSVDKLDIWFQGEIEFDTRNYWIQDSYGTLPQGLYDYLLFYTARFSMEIGPLRYVGEYDKGLPNGFGLLIDNDGNTLYEGNWLNGKRHGVGRWQDINMQNMNRRNIEDRVIWRTSRFELGIRIGNE